MNKSTRDIIAIVSLVLLALVLIGVGPLITIWSLNVVFNLQIAYGFTQWLGILILQVATFGGIQGRLQTLINKL